MGANRLPLPKTETKAEQAVLEIITSHRGLISIVFDMDYERTRPFSPFIDYTYIDENYLDQLADPNKNRPSRSATYFKEHERPLPAVLKKMNMKTLRVHDHIPGMNRVTKHAGEEFQFTPKTSTSLIPPDPRYMELFECDYGIGFLWDIDECNIKKEKYVFYTNAGTDGCFWIDLDTDQKIQNLKERLQSEPLATIESLRAQNMRAIETQTAISWNEILAGLPKRNIRAVFATQDERSSRLRALRAMQRAKEKLNFADDLPLFVLQPFYEKDSEDPVPDRPAVFRFYLKAEQEADLKAEAADKLLEDAVLNMIKNHRALALLVPDEKSLDDYLDQLVDPTTNRPSCSAAFFKRQGVPTPEVIKKVNLETFRVHDHKPGMCRETKHKGEIRTHTAKVKTVLLPPEPQLMDLTANQEGIGLLWDIEACELKNNKYVFQGNEMTDDCFWLNVDSIEKLDALKKRFETTPVGDLAAVRRNKNQRNTILAGLPKGRVDGIFCLSDHPDHRLKALDMMMRMKEKLKLDVNLPIFIIQSSTDYPGVLFRVYHDFEQVIDRTEAAKQQALSSAPDDIDGFVFVNPKPDDAELQPEDTRSRCLLM